MIGDHAIKPIGTGRAFVGKHLLLGGPEEIIVPVMEDGVRPFQFIVQAIRGDQGWQEMPSGLGCAARHADCAVPEGRRLRESRSKKDMGGAIGRIAK